MRKENDNEVNYLQMILKFVFIYLSILQKETTQDNNSGPIKKKLKI